MDSALPPGVKRSQRNWTGELREEDASGSPAGMELLGMGLGTERSDCRLVSHMAQLRGVVRRNASCVGARPLRMGLHCPCDSLQGAFARDPSARMSHHPISLLEPVGSPVGSRISA